MSDTKARVVRPGHRIALGQDVYTVIQLNGTTVTLQDQHGARHAHPGRGRRPSPRPRPAGPLPAAEPGRTSWLTAGAGRPCCRGRPGAVSESPKPTRSTARTWWLAASRG